MIFRFNAAPANGDVSRVLDVATDLFESAPIGFALYQVGSGFLQANQAFRQMLGYSNEELHGLQVRQVFHPDDVSTVESCDQLLLSGEHDRYLREYRLVRKDHRVLWTRSHACAVRSARGRLRFVLLMVEDITERRQLEEQILETRAAERRTIAHDLHDGLGQQLTSTAFKAKLLETMLAERAPDLAASAREIIGMVNAGIDQVRRVAQELDAVEVGTCGLDEALNRLAEEIRTVFQIPCKFQRSKSLPDCNQSVCLNLYRIAQESVRNAVEHGRAREIGIKLIFRGNQLRLEIQDNGCGFANYAGARVGMGLRIMRYRAQTIGGTLLVHSVMDVGTRITCLITSASMEKNTATPISASASVSRPPDRRFAAALFTGPPTAQA